MANHFCWDRKELVKALKFALAAASKDRNRSHLQVVHFALNGEVVGTDGHRVHVYPLPASGFSFSISSEQATKLTKRLQSSKAEEISVIDNCNGSIIWTVNEYQSVTKVPDHVFPPYGEVFSKSYESRIQIGAKEFRNILKKFLDRRFEKHKRKSPRIRIISKMDGTLELFERWSLGTDTDPGIIESMLYAADYPKEFEINIDHKYLKQSMMGASSIVIQFNGPLDVIRVDHIGSDAYAAVMPCRM